MPRYARHDLEAAARGLAKIVRDEYPPDESLADIAYIWGTGIIFSPPATADEVEAIRRLEDAGLFSDGSNDRATR